MAAPVMVSRQAQRRPWLRVAVAVLAGAVLFSGGVTALAVVLFTWIVLMLALFS